MSKRIREGNAALITIIVYAIVLLCVYLIFRNPYKTSSSQEDKKDTSINTVSILENTIQDKNKIIAEKERVISLLEKKLEEKNNLETKNNPETKK